MIPALVATAGEYRALTVHDVVPAGHVAVPVLHDRWSPHIRIGDLTVLDPSDTEPQLGELYGLMISSPRFPSGQVLKIVQPYRSRTFGGSDGAHGAAGHLRPGRVHRRPQGGRVQPPRVPRRPARRRACGSQGCLIRPPKGREFGAAYTAVIAKWWGAIEACPDHAERVADHVLGPAGRTAS